MSNFQHPGDSSKLSAELKAKVLENYNGGLVHVWLYHS
jgi:hypothetical protein